MNKFISNAIIASIALLIFLPITGYCQEKKAHVKTVKVVDGDKVVSDTVFIVKDDVGEKEIVKTFTWVSNDDSDSTVIIDLDIDSDIDFDSEKKWVVVKSEKDGNVKMTHDNKSKKYVIRIDKDDKGERNVYMFDGDGDYNIIDRDELHDQLEEHKEQLKNIKIELDGERIIMIEELEGLEELKELKELEVLVELEDLEELKELKELEVLAELDEIKNIKIDIPEGNEFFIHEFHYSDNVSDKELRDAGLKNKADRLEADNFNIDIDNGIVDIEFTLKTEGDPKVAVYNYFGDKVFTGKPEIMNGKYTIKMDLSTKQHGTYFLQVVQKNSSFTKKLRL